MSILITNPSKGQIEKWMMDPKFASNALLEQSLPTQVSHEGIVLWNKVLGRSDKPKFIAEYYCTENFDTQSLVARNRYPHLEELCKHHCSEWPTAHILLSECLYLMDDIGGASIYGQKAQGQVGIGKDIVLDQCIVFLKKCEMESMKEHEEENEEGDTCSVYRRPEQYISSAEPS
eukprot:CAMPEP_0170841582 /NCGR_PEP_ID=MMETSP0734-20130129/5260_1 /TAXON_ID=186038 /ORGANISM="Fragilariopsis kerguelensis, Strain L26-C5" /LENGTH=174 /DNA_ID=CAMNT_0011209611 /DNA_START=60 /DNA_END=581 /DNA_ORIENTATION=+